MEMGFGAGQGAVGLAEVWAGTGWPHGLSLPVPLCRAGMCQPPAPHKGSSGGCKQREDPPQGCWTFSRNSSLAGKSACVEGKSSPSSWGRMGHMGDPGAFKAEGSASPGSRPDSGRAELSRAPSVLCRGGGRCQQAAEVGPGFAGAG